MWDNPSAVNLLLGWSWSLGVDGLTSGQHLDKLADAPGAGFGPLCVCDSVEDDVSIRLRQHLKHCLRTRIGTQRSDKIPRHLRAGLTGVGGPPPAVSFRLP